MIMSNFNLSIVSKESFNILIEKVGPDIENQDTHSRRCVCVRERLMIIYIYRYMDIEYTWSTRRCNGNFN